MTLIEFLSPLSRAGTRERVLAILYFKHRYEHIDSLTVQDIRNALRKARVPHHAKMNVADVLAKSGHLVDSPGSQNSRLLWKLTDTGGEHIRKLLSLPSAEPEIESDVGSLSVITAKISNENIQKYLDEAIKCLQIGARRASVVFLWTGAIRVLQTEMLKKHSSTLNMALQKFDQKTRSVSKLDDFSYVKDKNLLLTAQEIGILDKSERETLEEALSLRNRCSHPAKYEPGEKKVSSFIEDIIQIVFS